MSQSGMADPHQLFHDTSSAQSQSYGMQRAAGVLGYPADMASSQATFLTDPMSNMAMVCGSNLAAQGKELVDKNVSGWAQGGEHYVVVGDRGGEGTGLQACVLSLD